MSVDQFDVVDITSISENGEVVLTISDHFDWHDTIRHQATLQKKLNAYLTFVESGEILRRYPDAKERSVVFEVVFRFKPDEGGRLFLELAQQVIESAGLDLRYRLFAESYNN